ncbi:MAG: hypothetical protein MR601_07345 [Erysipelotrichaceae bacterium]|nr:hypothetical protein [Erysipelotrichaceae bacterium]
MGIDEIKELINLDLCVQENLEIRHNEKNALKLNLENEKRELSEEAWAKIKEKVKQSKLELDEQIKMNEALNKKFLDENIKKLEDIYNNKYDEWVELLFNKCID